MNLALMYAMMRGWASSAHAAIEEGRLHFNVGLCRPVGDGFALDQLDQIARGARLIDPELGRVKDGYRLGLELPGKSRLMRDLGFVVDPAFSDTPFLTFAYSGNVEPSFVDAFKGIVAGFEQIEATQGRRVRMQTVIGKMKDGFRKLF